MSQFEKLKQAIQSSPYPAEYWIGYINAACVYDGITEKEWGELYDIIKAKEKKQDEFSESRRNN